MAEQPQPKRATLADVINYEPERYITDADLAVIKTLTPEHLAIIRKVLLPTISDPNLPIEEMGQDAYLMGIDWLTMSADHAKAIIQGRQEAIKFVLGGLVKLRIMANGSVESPLQKEIRQKKDSAR